MGLGVNLGQVNFSKGVLAPELHARVDIATYGAGLKRGENVVILKRGGLANRMGTRLVYELPGEGRLFPFEYSIDQTYALAFTQGRMTPMALGGVVLEEELEITGITNANPAVVTVPYHGMATGDQWFAGNVEGMIEINGRILPVTVIDGDTFSVGIDSTSWGVFTGSGGGTLRTAPPAPEPDPVPVPDPVTPPAPPPVGGGGGGGYYSDPYCVAIDTPILMADGSERMAGDLIVGDMLLTQHETTLEWGEYPVEAIAFADDTVYRSDDVPVLATAAHRFFIGGEWVAMEEIGEPVGKARIAKITVTDAHTYVSNGVLSHNIKAQIP